MQQVHHPDPPGAELNPTRKTSVLPTSVQEARSAEPKATGRGKKGRGKKQATLTESEKPNGLEQPRCMSPTKCNVHALQKGPFVQTRQQKHANIPHQMLRR
jgi:hypothetical protein